MATVGGHQQAPFAIPINGASPIDADEVRLNDNSMATSYNSHDADPALHVQSSTLALRPTAGTAGRLWFTTDERRLYYDTGTLWQDQTMDAGDIDSGTLPAGRLAGAYTGITQVGTLPSLNVTGAVAAGSLSGPLTGNVTGDVTGNVTGNVSGNAGGNAGTATKLSSARSFALTGDVTGSVSSDLTSGASIAATYAGTVPVARGGTGLTAAPTDGQIPIGNGTGYTLAQLTAGTNIAITNTPGGISIAATGTASGVSGTGTTNTVPRWVGTTQIGDSGITDNGTVIALTRSQAQLGTVAYTVPTVQGAVNSVLTNNGSGTLSWQPSGLVDATIAPSLTDPYGVLPADVSERLVVTTASPTEAYVALGSANSLATGSRIGVYSRDTITQVPLTIGTPAALTMPAPNGSVDAIAVQADGKIVIGGQFSTVGATARTRLARINADGTLDTGFSGQSPSNTVRAIAIQSDGAIIIGGDFTDVSGAGRNRLARISSTAVLESFNPNANGIVRAIAVQSDGKILVGGDFTTVGGTTRNRIARLNTDGTLDTGYNPNLDGAVFAIVVQPDGRALVGGAFTTIGGTTTRIRVARLNTDGTVDTSYTNSSTSNTVSALALQSDGMVLIGVSTGQMLRSTSTGANDGTFTCTVNNAVNAIALHGDGILIGGTFGTVNGTSRNFSARLTSTGALDTGWNAGSSTGQVNAIALTNGGNAPVFGGTINSIYSSGANLARVRTFVPVTINTPFGTASGSLLTLPRYANVVFEKTGAASWAIAESNSEGVVNQQTFDSSGTWTNPGIGSVALIEVWGAGGSGGANTTAAQSAGGGGGAYVQRVMRLADLPSTVSATVGAGGGARATAAAGLTGGNSSFGTFVTAYGGEGGSITANDYTLGGTAFRAGARIASTALVALDYPDQWDRTNDGGMSSLTASDLTFWKNTINGGAAGMTKTTGNATTGYNAGTSVAGGNGGAFATAGTTPGGGGGAGNTSTAQNSGAGGSGRIRITVW